MKYIKEYKIFERKGNYQLFHKTNEYALNLIVNSGFIKCGGDSNDDEDDYKWWNYGLRKNVFSDWKQDDKKFKTISATRNLDYLWLPALELDVEKISDKYRIVPFSENPDYYLDFYGGDDGFASSGEKYGKMKSRKNPILPLKNKKKLTNFQNMIRSKSKDAGKLFWRFKTDKDVMDYGIAEELILTDKLDFGKYVKRVILRKDFGNENEKLIKLINKKYPNVEVVEIDRRNSGGFNYMDVKRVSKQKEKEKELALQESKKPIPEYKKGDYVHLEDDETWTVYQTAKVISLNSNVDLQNNDYYIEAFLKQNNKPVEFWVDDYDIDRKSTNEEIAELEIIKNAIKYNL